MIALTNGKPDGIHPGSGHLGVEMVAGRSAVTSAFASSPLKILVPRPRGPSVWAYLSSFGGGMVAGDETRLAVEIGPGARCFLSTQASTKVYRNPPAKPCSHRLEVRLGAGSILAYVPDPIQPFADSSYTQRQEFHLGQDSGLVVVERLSSGRAAFGERWAFRQYQSRVDVYADDVRVLADSLLMDRDAGALGEPHGTGRFNALALVLILGSPFRAVSARLLEEAGAEPVKRQAGFIRSASPIRGGALFRFAGVEAEEVAGEVRRDLAFLSEFLHDDPWRRKW